MVKGRVDKAGTLGGVLEKDEKANKVTIKDAGEGKEVCTIYEPAAYADGLTLLSIELVTGKTHQIRAHMAGIGHPLLGDAKYGDRSFNEAYRKKGVKSQLLHAQRMVFPTLRELPEEELPVYADPNMMQRALHNLLGNAMHHIGGDGIFLLRASKVPEGVRVEIEDHGPGICAEDLPYIFDRYYRSRSDAGKQGTGLGLSITKAIFQQHGFRFGVQSTLGKGTTFWFIATDTK